MDRCIKEILLSLEWYESRVHHGILRFAQDHNWRIYSNAHNLPTPTNIVLDGMIVSVTEDEHIANWVRSKDIPCISVCADGFDLRVPKVELDHYACGAMAATFFAQRKFRNFACLYPHPHEMDSWFRQRIDGFCDTVRGLGGNLHLQTRTADDTIDQTEIENRMKIKWYRQQLNQLPLPCALFLPDDDMVTLLQTACSESGLLIPEDIAMMGLNNDLLTCPYSDIPLSSVDPGWEQIGYHAATMLYRLMEGEQLPNDTFKIAPTGVIERQSSSIVAVDDCNVSQAVVYISQHVTDDPTVDDICKAVKISRRKLEEAFRKHLKRGIKQEVRMARVEEVKKMLLETDLTAVAISKKQNFNNEFQMYKVFKRGTGMTTGEFRMRYKRNFRD